MNEALPVKVIGQTVQLLQSVPRQQVAIDQHMVLVGSPFAEFFHIGANQIRQPRVFPMVGKAIQPGSINQLGRSDGAKKIKRMGAARKIAPRGSPFALLQVGAVTGVNRLRVVMHPRDQILRGFRQVG